MISPLYFTEKHYYLLPDGPTAQLPYNLLVQAMLARGVQAVAQGNTLPVSGPPPNK